MKRFTCTVLFLTPELQLNQTGSSDTEAPFLNVHLPISKFYVDFMVKR